jgi:hypothetical protein
MDDPEDVSLRLFASLRFCVRFPVSGVVAESHVRAEFGRARQILPPFALRATDDEYGFGYALHPGGRDGARPSKLISAILSMIPDPDRETETETETESTILGLLARRRRLPA